VPKITKADLARETLAQILKTFEQVNLQFEKRRNERRSNNPLAESSMCVFCKDSLKRVNEFIE
jgi:hypothetical protein